MLAAKIKDLKYRSYFLKIEKKRLLNKFLFIYLLNKKKKFNLKVKQRKLNKYKFFFMKKKNFSKLALKTKTKLVRRCAITNRGRGVFRPYNLSRFILRDFLQFGILPGYRKAVW